MSSKLTTDWLTIGRSGKTVDGRQIDPNWLVEAAESYDTALFTALIWPDHRRWFNMGKVAEVRHQTNSEGGVDLQARLNPNEWYLGSNRDGQRLFTSMELQPNFRETGKYYLAGLAATDDPASAGTSEVRFSRIGNDQVLVGQPQQVQLFTPQTPAADDDTVPGWFRKLFNLKTTTDPDEDDDMSKDALELLTQQMTALAEQFAKAFPQPDKTADKNADTTGDKTGDDDETSEFSQQLTDLKTEFATLAESIKPVIDHFNSDGDGDGDEQPAAPTATEYAALQDGLKALTDKFNAALQEQPGTQTDEATGGGDASDYL